MLVRGPLAAVNTLLLHANHTRGRFAGGHGPWADPRMDGRFLTSPFGGTVNNGLQSLQPGGDPGFILDGSGNTWGDSPFNQFITELGGFEQTFEGGDFTLRQDFFNIGGGEVNTVPVVVLTDLSLEGSNVVGTFTPMLVNQVFPSVEAPIIPTRVGCCDE